MTPATHTLLIGLNPTCQFQCESLSSDLACPSGEIGGFSSFWLRCTSACARMCPHTHNLRTCKEHMQLACYKHVLSTIQE